MYLNIKAPNKESFQKFYNTFNRKEIKKSNNIIFDEFNYNKNLKITFYKNHSILFNGIIDDSIKKNFEILIDKTLYIGIDEVGVGENFGPFVSCGFTFNNLSSKIKALELGIRDSKSLDMKKINLIANQLDNFGKSYIVIIEPEKLNKMWKEQVNNMKAINAISTNQIARYFQKLNRPIVIDKFVEEKKYFEYLNKYTHEKYEKNIIFETKSEDKYLEVAAAAIIAKNKFNNWVLKFLKENGINYHFTKNIHNDLWKKLKIDLDEKGQSKILKEWKK